MAGKKYTPERRLATFWSCVDKSGGDDACWIWTRGKLPKGYGRFNADGKDVLAHRFAYEKLIGEIPDGLHVCHHCDNPSCVNPKHLFVGTRSDNMQDMWEKKRAGAFTHPERLARGTRNGTYTHPEKLRRGDDNSSRLHPERLRRGDNHGRSLVTSTQVVEIRRRYADGGVTIKALAKAYGLSFSATGSIIRRETWRHIS